MKIGDKVWIKDGNHRVYEKGSNAPIYREYFVERYIIGETTQSWILGYYEDSLVKHGSKYKKRAELKSIYISLQEVNDECWRDKNCYRIAELVKRCYNVKILKDIENMLVKKDY